MMSKFFSKTVKKTTLWSVLMAIVIAAAVVIGCLFGFQKDVSVDNQKVLKLTVNSYAYNTEKDRIYEECDILFESTSFKYSVEGEKSGDSCEILFVFDKDEDIAKIKEETQRHFTDKTWYDESWKGAYIYVSASTESSAAVLAEHYVLRAAIAAVVLAVLAFAYAAIRYQKLSVGLLVGLCALLSMSLTGAVIILTRVLVTSSVAGAILISGLLTAATLLFNFGKLRTAKKENADASLEELVVSSLAAKEILLLAGSLAAAILVVGVVGRTATSWFAVSAIIGIAVSVFLSLIFAPAAYLSMQTRLEGKPAKNAYVGAKKTSKKAKKAPVKAVAETEEAPVEEAPAEEIAEEPVEEAPVEEAPAEEPVEEAPVEEAPAEEIAEEEASEE